MRIKTPATRLIAAFLSSALILLSFGPDAWAALVPKVPDIKVAVDASVPAAGSVNRESLADFSALELSPAALPSVLSVPAATPMEGTGAAAEESPSLPAAASPEIAEAGPLTAGVGARISRPITEISGSFSERRDADRTPAAESSAAATRRMLGRYILADNSAGVGYEGMALATMPIYLAQNFHDVSLMADLSIAGTLAGMLGRQLSPLIINSMPLKKAYLGLLGATFAGGLAIGVLANLHLLTVPALFGLMICYRLVRDASTMASRTVIPSVLGADQAAIEGLRGGKQSWGEVRSVLVQNGASSLVALWHTAAANLLIAPFFTAAAYFMVRTWLKIPEAADKRRMAAWREQASGTGAGPIAHIKDALKNFVRQVALGAKVVMHDPALRASAVIAALMTMFNIQVYNLLASQASDFAIAAGANPDLAAPIMGLVAGLFSFGGLFAGKRVAAPAHGQDSKAAREAARASTMRWLTYAALSFLSIGVMALPLPAVDPLIQLGSYASIAVTAVLGTGTILAMWKPKLGLALAMAPVVLAFPSHVAIVAAVFFAFGFVQVVASVKNDSLFDALVQEKAPADYANAASFVEAFSLFAGMIGLVANKFMTYGSLPFGIPSPLPAFHGATGIWTSIMIFAGLAVPSTLTMLYFKRRLRRAAPRS